MREEGGYRSQRAREREEGPRPSDGPRLRVSAQAWLGVAIVIVGTAFLLDNLGVVSSREIIRWLPLILVGAGLNHMFRARRRAQTLWGAVLAALGILLQLGNLGVVTVNLWSLWPLLLILLGIRILARARPGAAGRNDAVDTARAEEVAFLGGVDRSVASAAFEGGTVTAFMGGVDLDLRQAKMTGRTVTIDVFVMMGGVDLRVPDDWAVVSRVTPILGSVEDKSRPQGDTDGTLVLEGSVIMGAVEIS